MAKGDAGEVAASQHTTRGLFRLNGEPRGVVKKKKDMLR